MFLYWDLLVCYSVVKCKAGKIENPCSTFAVLPSFFENAMMVLKIKDKGKTFDPDVLPVSPFMFAEPL